MTGSEAPEKPGRKNQPRCSGPDGCSHPISFHGGGTSRCKALGCKCPSWHAPEAAEPVKTG